MTLSPDSRLFIFDVESISVHGPGFAVACGVYDGTGRELLACCMHVKVTSDMADGIPKADREWVAANVTVPGDSVLCPDLPTLYAEFWSRWEDASKQFPGIILAAECMVPVESNFLRECIKARPSRKETWPYPPIDIASIMLAAGMDPMVTYPRLEHELPAHDPLADTRQSARLLAEAIRRLQPEGLPA